MEAKMTWVEGLQFIGRADSGHAVVMDTSLEFGGTESAARPMELVLIALATCSAMDVVGILRKRRKEPQHFTIIARAERATEDPRAFTDIELEYVLAGDFTPAEVEHAIELSQNRYCSVAAMLKPKVNITTKYRIEQP